MKIRVIEEDDYKDFERQVNAWTSPDDGSMKKWKLESTAITQGSDEHIAHPIYSAILSLGEP